MKNLSVKYRLLVLAIIPVFLFLLLTAGYLFPATRGINMAVMEAGLLQKLEGDIYSTWLIYENHFGELRLQGDILVDQDGMSIEGRYEMVDEVTEKLGNVATVFVIDGDDYRRLITSIIMDDGERAVGTYLGQDSAAYAPNHRGELYIGEAEILGKSYYTAYDPIMENGEVIGILFIGVERNQVMDMMARRSGSLALAVFGGLAVIAGLVAVLSWLIINPIIKNTRTVTDLISRSYAEGNLEEEVPESMISAGDEYGELARGLKKMQGSMKDAVIKLNALKDQIVKSGEGLSASSQQMNASLEEVASTVNEFTGQTTELAESATNMNQVSAELAENTQEGLTVVNDAVDGMGSVSDVMEELKGSVDELNEKSGAITNIINSIRGIADQTNLLALNAAIEAARAGDAGKGFAVVAEEIRKLADQSSTATNDISDIIGEIQNQVGDTVSRMDSGREDVVENINKVKKAGEIIMGLVRGVESVTENIQRVAEASQNIGSESEELAASIEEQSSTMHEVAESANLLQEVIKDIDAALDWFKINLN